MKVLLISEGKHELSGALQMLVRRLRPGIATCDTMKVSDARLRVHSGKGRGYFKKAVRCLIHAVECGYDAVVLVIDQDDDRSRRQQISEAHDHDRVHVRRAFGVAVRTFDAWMLADEVALSEALGATIQKQPDPETLHDAKALCTNLSRHRNEGGLRDVYLAVARVARLDVLEERCPEGFGPFAVRVRAL